MVAVPRRRRTVFLRRFINKASAVVGAGEGLGGGGGGGVLAWLPPLVEDVATSEKSRGNSYQTGFLCPLREPAPRSAGRRVRIKDSGRWLNSNTISGGGGGADAKSADAARPCCSRADAKKELKKKKKNWLLKYVKFFPTLEDKHARASAAAAAVVRESSSRLGRSSQRLVLRGS